MESLRRLAPAVLAFCLATGLYLNAVPGEYVFDDISIISENPAVRGAGGLRGVLTAEYGVGTELWRPLTLLSHYVEHALFGLEPAWPHLVNALLHGLATLLLLFLLRRLTGDRRLALFAALLFAVHPIHTEAVAYITGRAELLAAVFFLAAYLVWLRARDASPRGPGSLGLFVSALLLFLGLLCKENAATLAGVVVAGELVFRRGEGRLAPRRLALTAACLLAPAALYLLLKYMVLGSLFAPHTTVVNNPTVAALFWQRWATAAAVGGRSLELFLLPWSLAADYTLAAVPVVRGAGEAAFYIASALLALAFVILLVRRRPVLLFAVLWMLITYSIVSNVLFPIGTLMAERLLYLPSAGFCLLLAAGLRRIEPSAPPGAEERRRFVTAGTVLLCVFLFLWGVRTYYRNLDWRTSYALFSSAVRAEPRSAKARVNYAVALSMEGRYKEAVAQCEEALRIAPGFRDGRRVLALALASTDRREEALGMLQRLSEKQPDDANSPFRLGQLLLDDHRPRDAIHYLKMAVARAPDNAEAWRSLSVALAAPKVRDVQEAWKALERARALNPFMRGLTANRGLLLMNLGRPCEAIGVLEEAARRGEMNPTAARALQDARSICPGGPGGAKPMTPPPVIPTATPAAK